MKKINIRKIHKMLLRKSFIIRKMKLKTYCLACREHTDNMFTKKPKKNNNNNHSK